MNYWYRMIRILIPNYYYEINTEIMCCCVDRFQPSGSTSQTTCKVGQNPAQRLSQDPDLRERSTDASMRWPRDITSGGKGGGGEGGGGPRRSRTTKRNRRPRLTVVLMCLGCFAAALNVCFVVMFDGLTQVDSSGYLTVRHHTPHRPAPRRWKMSYFA